MKIEDKVAVVVVNPKGDLLILKRSSGMKEYPNLWNLPSGGVKDAEGLSDAARRETFEETGLEISNLRNGIITRIKNGSTTYLINYFLSETQDSQVTINSESSEYKWVTPKESLDYQFAVSRQEVEKILKEFGLV